MANIETKLIELTECSICLKTFTDPRLLPCVHTFCLQCLEQFINKAEKKAGDKIPCPLCRTEFIIPENGVTGLKKHFFIEQLTDIQKSAKTQASFNSLVCDICRAKAKGEGRNISTATMRCLECQENLCEDCTSTHKVMKLTKYHHIVDIGNDSREETNKLIYAKFCPTHAEKTLDYYCTQCKQTVCVSCFVETHSTHGCRDVNSAGKDFLSKIQENVNKLTPDSVRFQSRRKSSEQNRKEFLKSVEEKEKLILHRSQMLKELIDRQAKSLLEELQSLKEEHIKKMKMDTEEIETGEAILQNFKEYCNMLTSKGSPGHICDCFDDIMSRVDELKRRDEALLGRPQQKVEISLTENELTEALALSNDNCIGNIAFAEQFLVVVGIDDDPSIADVDVVYGIDDTTSEVLKINLHFPDDVQHLPDIPTLMKDASTAGIHNNTMYVIGIGRRRNEIWKYDTVSDWNQCANLIQGRERHSAAFVHEVLYICGGYIDADKCAIDSIESYSANTNECRTVGKLIHRCQASGNCVSYKRSLYIFGGIDKYDNNLRHVQVYNTATNTCSLLKHPMPSASCLKRAVVWEDSVILLGPYTCDIYDFKTESWIERKQFKTDSVHFGICLMNDRVYVIGGGDSVKDSDGKWKWICRDDVRYVSVVDIIENRPVKWKEHVKLPKPCLVHAFGIMSLTSQKQLFVP